LIMTTDRDCHSMWPALRRLKTVSVTILACQWLRHFMRDCSLVYESASSIVHLAAVLSSFLMYNNRSTWQRYNKLSLVYSFLSQQH